MSEKLRSKFKEIRAILQAENIQLAVSSIGEEPNGMIILLDKESGEKLCLSAQYIPLDDLKDADSVEVKPSSPVNTITELVCISCGGTYDHVTKSDLHEPDYSMEGDCQGCKDSKEDEEG